MNNNNTEIKNSELSRVMKSNLAFALIAFPLLIIIEYIFPALKIPFKFYNKVYSLLNFSTAHLDLSKLFSYILFLIFGFSFINIVNLKNKRENPLIGPNGYSDTKKVIYFGFIIFFLSGNFLLLGKYDFEGFCKGDKKIKNVSDDILDFYNKLYSVEVQNKISNIKGIKNRESHIFKNTQIQNTKIEINNDNNKNYYEINYFESDNFDDKENQFNNINKNKYLSSNRRSIGFIKRLAYNISLGLYSFCKNLSEWFKPEFYFKDFQTDCKYPVFFERIFQNYIFFVLPFILGLNFTYLDYIPELQKFTLSWHDMKNWGWHLWTLFIALCLFILFTLGFLFYSLIHTSLVRFGFYVVFFLGLILYTIIRTQKEKKNHKHFHLHHYALMLVLNWFLGIHHDYFLILLGIFSGIMIEGCCRWGVGSCWNSDEAKS